MQFAGGCRSAGAVAKTPKRGDEEGTLPARRRPLRGNEEVLPPLEGSELRWEHAGDGVVGAIEPNRLSDDIVAAAQSPLPQAVADDDGARMARPSVLFCEIAADGRCDPEQPEVRPRHLSARQTLRDRPVAEGHGAPPVSGDRLEVGLLRIESEVVRNREGEPVGRGVCIDSDELFWILVRQRLEKGRVDGREDRGRCADAKADGDDDGQRQGGARSRLRRPILTSCARS